MKCRWLLLALFLIWPALTHADEPKKVEAKKEVKFKVESDNKEVTATAADIAADKKDGELVVTASDKAEGKAKITITGTSEGAEIEAIVITLDIEKAKTEKTKTAA